MLSTLQRVPFYRSEVKFGHYASAAQLSLYLHLARVGGPVSPNFPQIAGYACGRFYLRLWPMVSARLIAATVSPEMKARFRSFAERQQKTESALLRQLIDRAKWVALVRLMPMF